VVQLDREASQTRGYCVANSATHRAARPDSLGFARDRLFTAQSTLVQDDNRQVALKELAENSFRQKKGHNSRLQDLT
jgi:hypothetical protein